MMRFVIKLEGMYFGDTAFRHRVVFSPKFEDATFFSTVEEAKKALTENNLPEYCKIKQVTYVEHDIGYIEHAPVQS